MTRSRSLLLLGLLALPAFLALLACTDDGAKFVEGDTLIFAGSMEPDELSSREDFIIVETGLVEFHLDELTVTLPETGETVVGGTLGISIGRPDDSSGVDACQPSFSNFVRLGEKAQIHLQPVVYCLQVFRAAGVPDLTLVDYLITAYTRSAAP